MRRKLASLLALATAALAIAAPALASGRQTEAAKTVGSVATVEYRAVLTAARTSAGPAPTAAVTLTSYTRVDGRWARSGALRLSGKYFWKTVSAAHSVCRLELTSADGSAAPRPSVTASILISPSIGCGRAQTLPLPAS
jgi:hypothetical protein